MGPRGIAVLRLLGWLLAVLGAGLVVIGAGTLGGSIIEAGARAAAAVGLLLVAAAIVAGFASAMLFGFAANLELLREIRDELRRQRPPRDQGGS